MYTLFINEDSKIITSNAERIVQRTNLTNTIRFLVDNEYNGIFMNSCTAILFYKLPISNEWHSKELTPSAELYKDKYTEYVFQSGTWLTAEFGDVELEVRFYLVDMNGNLDIEQYVRKATDGKIHISASKDWAAGVADPLLDSFDQRIIQLMMVQNRQDEMIAETQDNCAASLGVTDGKLHLVTAGGEQKGNAVDVVLPRTADDDGLNDGLIELGEIVHDESDPNCDCGCDHDNFEELDSYVASQPETGNGNFSEL